MAETTVSANFSALKTAINKSPTLSTNPAVANAMNAVEAELALNKSKIDYFQKLDQIFSSLSFAIPKFDKVDSTTTEIIESVLIVTSAVVKVAGIITGTKAIMGPLSSVLSAVGAIFGVFGISKSTRYAKALIEMVNTANDTSLSKAMNQQLKGAMDEIYSRHNTVAYLLSIDYTTNVNDLEEKNSNTITTEYFREPGIFQLGEAFNNIETNAAKDSHQNWPNAAVTYFVVSQLIGLKILFYLEGIAYFNLAEKTPFDATSGYSVTQNALDGFRGDYLAKSALYFGKPGIINAAITHCIYRLNVARFAFLATVFDFLDGQREIPFWPVGEKDSTWFTCSLSPGHPSPGVNYSICCRLATLLTHYKSKVLTVHGHEEAAYSMYDSDMAYKAPLFEKDTPKEIKDQARTHFELTENNTKAYTYLEDKSSERKIIPYSWLLKAKKSQIKYNSTSATGKSKVVFYHDNDIYVFKVYPTLDEIANVNKATFPNAWEARPVAGKTYVMIGSRGGDELVWCDHNGKGDVEKHSYHSIVYNADHFGNPEHCMWQFLGENET